MQQRGDFLMGGSLVISSFVRVKVSGRLRQGELADHQTLWLQPCQFQPAAIMSDI